VAIARRVVGAVLVLTGAVWVGQGLGAIGGSFMTGSAFWAGVGAGCGVVGLGLLGWPWRSPREPESRGRRRYARRGPSRYAEGRRDERDDS